MATTFSGNITISVNAVLRDDLDLSDPADIAQFLHKFTLTDGAGANQCNQMWHDQRTLAASATENLDLSGSLTNQYGTSVVFARVKGLFVLNASAIATITLRGAAANGWSTMFQVSANPLILQPGAPFVNYAPNATGYLVTAGTGDTFRVNNNDGSNSATYDILIIGSTT